MYAEFASYLKLLGIDIDKCIRHIKKRKFEIKIILLSVLGTFPDIFTLWVRILPISTFYIKIDKKLDIRFAHLRKYFRNYFVWRHKQVIRKLELLSRLSS